LYKTNPGWFKTIIGIIKKDEEEQAQAKKQKQERIKAQERKLKQKRIEKWAKELPPPQPPPLQPPPLLPLQPQPKPRTRPQPKPQPRPRPRLNPITNTTKEDEALERLKKAITTNVTNINEDLEGIKKKDNWLWWILPNYQSGISVPDNTYVTERTARELLTSDDAGSKIWRELFRKLIYKLTIVPINRYFTNKVDKDRISNFLNFWILIYNDIKKPSWFKLYYDSLEESNVYRDRQIRNSKIKSVFREETHQKSPPSRPRHAWLPPIPRGVKVLETYRINILSGGTATLCISNGSFVNFKGGDHGAIVNAANGGGIGGGGADGAVNSMGESHNPNLDLKTARENEMTQRNKKPLDYGEVMITSAPLGKFYGKLQSRHVIHAVGPDYRTMCELGDGINLKYDSDSLQLELDKLLYDAYKNSIQKASENGVKALGFCLLSGNIYRKNNNQEDIVSLNHVIKLGMNSIMHNAYNGLEVHMIAFEDDEEQIKTLLEEFNKKIKSSRGGKRTSKKKVKRTKK